MYVLEVFSLLSIASLPFGAQKAQHGSFLMKKQVEGQARLFTRMITEGECELLVEDVKNLMTSIVLL